jgi:hypothetical protein
MLAHRLPPWLGAVLLALALVALLAAVLGLLRA